MKKALTILLTICLMVTSPALTIMSFADSDPATALPFSSGDTVYVQTNGADYIEITPVNGQSPDGKPCYAFYKEAVKVLRCGDTDGVALVESAGGQYYIPVANLTATKPVYRADTSLRQAIINSALAYNKGVANTCYTTSSNPGVYYGQYSPDEAKYCFDCIGFVRSMVETEIKKSVPTYDLPPSTKEMHQSMKKGEFIFNEGYKNPCKITKVSESAMKAGDIILFDNEDAGYATHAGIYLGNGDYIHCSHGWGWINKSDGKYVRKEKYGGVMISRYANSRSQVVGIISVVPASTGPSNAKVSVTKGSKIRAAASTSAKVLRTVKKGSKVTLKYTDRRGLWAYVQYGSIKGFISQGSLDLITTPPKATNLVSLNGGKKKITVKWKKLSSGITGYQIQYSRKSNFKNAKKITISKKSKATKTISKLASKKKYYVRIRTYKKSGSIKKYSKWSKMKSIKTK